MLVTMLKKLNKPNRPDLKVMTYNLYPLSPSLKTFEPVDTTDTRYLNQTHAPLVDMLKIHLILISITKNGLTNHFHLPHHHSLINMLPSSSQMNHLLLFYQ